MCKEFIEAIERHCKGLNSVNPGVCGICPTCATNHNWELDRKDFTFVDNKMYLRGHLILELAKEDLDHYADMDMEDALWEEYGCAMPDIPEEAFQDAFDEAIRNGDVPDEGSFSWSSCDTCGSCLGGNRYDGHAFDKDMNLYHLDMCQDCLMFFANGDVPETWE